MDSLRWSVFTKGCKFNGADFLKVKRKCQLVVRLKANKYYHGLLCYLSSYINLLNIRLCGRLQVPGQFQTFSPWSKTYTGSRPHPMLLVIVIVCMFIQTFAIILGFAKQLFSIVWLIFWLDVQLHLASPSHWSWLFIYLIFVFCLITILARPCELFMAIASFA